MVHSCRSPLAGHASQHTGKGRGRALAGGHQLRKGGNVLYHFVLFQYYFRRVVFEGKALWVLSENKFFSSANASACHIPVLSSLAPAEFQLGGETEALGHARDTAMPRPCQDSLHKACHEGQAAANASKNVQWIRRQSRADAPSQASDSQSSPSTHSSLLVLDAAVGEKLLLPVQSRRLQCPPQKCSGSAECAFHTLQVLAWPTLSWLISLTDWNRQEVRGGSKLGNGTLHLREVSLLSWRLTLPEWSKDGGKKCSDTNSREDEVRIHLQDLTTKCWLKKETKNP